MASPEDDNVNHDRPMEVTQEMEKAGVIAFICWEEDNANNPRKSRWAMVREIFLAMQLRKEAALDGRDFPAVRSPM